MTRRAFGARSLVREAAFGLVERLHRAVLTIAGTVLGIATLACVYGLAATASGQVSDSFAILRATQVSVIDLSPTAEAPNFAFPVDADATARKLNGVIAAGQTWVIDTRGWTVSAGLGPEAMTVDLEVRAATPGLAQALGMSVSSGRFLQPFDEDHRAAACVLGSGAASRLHVTQVGSTIWLGAQPCSVVGIVADVERDPGAIGTVFLPARTARAWYGDPILIRPARMVVHTRPGAAEQVASELPLALRPDQPDILRVEEVPAPLGVETAVSTTLEAVFLALAAVTLIIAGVGITSTSIVSVIDRRHEIGLRRCMGARRTEIVAQITLENALLGGIGSVIGTAVGNLVVVAVSLANGWTAMLDPRVTVIAPLTGIALGAVAGIYPAILAGRIEPATALRG